MTKDEAAATAPLNRKDHRAGDYVVVLRDPAAAAYTGGVPGYAEVPKGKKFSPRATRTRAYVGHLERVQDEVASSVGVTPTASYTLATNGFAARLSAKQANRLANDPRVFTLVRSELAKVQKATSTTSYLGLEGADGTWQEVGGAASAGKGIVVGVIDTGIAPENPSFAGAPLSTTDGTEPFRSGDAIIFHKSDGTDFRGTCEIGEQFTAADCTTKIIGARYYIDGFGAAATGTAETGEYHSPRDGTSHGSHTASTAAGTLDVDAAGRGHISGVTPAAKIAVYKACWAGPDHTTDLDDGCATEDLLAAIDDSVRDGVDVINFSIGSGTADSTNSIYDQAFMAAASAGIFVATAGGNSGPDATTVDHGAPWLTTVAATTYPVSEATVTLGNGDAVLGASVSVPQLAVSGRFVNAADVALPGVNKPSVCPTRGPRPGEGDWCDRAVRQRHQCSVG